MWIENFGVDLLDLADIRDDSLRVEFGKGGKVRILYLNTACREAIDRWLDVRSQIKGLSGDAKKLYLLLGRTQEFREVLCIYS